MGNVGASARWLAGPRAKLWFDPGWKQGYAMADGSAGLVRTGFSSCERNAEAT